MSRFFLIFILADVPSGFFMFCRLMLCFVVDWLFYSKIFDNLGGHNKLVFA